MTIHMMKNMLIITGLASLLGACASTTPGETACTLPEGHNLDQAMSATRFELETGCESQFDQYFSRLLAVAEGDPKKENKGKFSDFLLWSNEQDLLSKQQAREFYNRYFGVKYVSLTGDYSICSETCPKKSSVLRDMRNELADKELGLLKVSADKRSFHRASQLYRETELVLEAACTACGPLE